MQALILLATLSQIPLETQADGLVSYRSRPWVASTTIAAMQFVEAPSILVGDGFHNGKRCEPFELLMATDRADNQNAAPDGELRRSCDGGMTWTPATPLPSTIERDMHYVLSRGPDGKLWAHWQWFHMLSPPPGGRYRRVCIAVSPDDGETWSPALIDGDDNICGPWSDGPNLSDFYTGGAGQRIRWSADGLTAYLAVHFRKACCSHVASAITWSTDGGHTWPANTTPNNPPPSMAVIVADDNVTGGRQFQWPIWGTLCDSDGDGEREEMVLVQSQLEKKYYAVRAPSIDGPWSAPTVVRENRREPPVWAQLYGGRKVAGSCGPVIIAGAKEMTAEWNPTKTVVRGILDISTDNGLTFSDGAQYQMTFQNSHKKSSLFETGPGHLAIAHAQSFQISDIAKTYVEILSIAWQRISEGP